MDSTLFLAFCASYFLIAISPGLCMTLSMSLGISIGLRRTLWMMLGELVGVALVGIAAMVGVGALLTNMPVAFGILKIVGALYLLWAAYRTWQSRVNAAFDSTAKAVGTANLISQGFLTAVANPKAWAFLAALLPPFLDADKPLFQQGAILIALMIVIEFSCLLIYAQGGRRLSKYLQDRGLGQWLNHIAASMMIVVALWLIFG